MECTLALLLASHLCSISNWCLDLLLPIAYLPCFITKFTVKVLNAQPLENTVSMSMAEELCDCCFCTCLGLLLIVELYCSNYTAAAIASMSSVFNSYRYRVGNIYENTVTNITNTYTNVGCQTFRTL